MTARSASPVTPDRPAGWTFDGRQSPHADPDSSASGAMRSLIVRRRATQRLTPREIAEIILVREANPLKPMFPMAALEHWAACDEWRAWELLEWTAAIEAHPGVAAITVIQCGYVNGEWWGGRFVSREISRVWSRRRIQRPDSAWFDKDLVERFAPPMTDVELIESTARVDALLPQRRETEDEPELQGEMEFTQYETEEESA